jgi:hypothetical protein
MSIERTMLIAERFLQGLIRKYGKTICVYPLMMVPDILKHAGSWNWSIIFIHRMRRALSKEQLNT